MIRHPGWTSAIFLGLPLVSLVLLWALFGPYQLGGSAAYVVTKGISMAPVYRTGDLAILRSAEYYEVGDIVAYQDPKIGRVLHRIHGREGDRFVMKGDNNDWLDPYKPAPDEVIGRLWVHLPGVGSWFAKLQQPKVAAVVGGGMGLLLVGGIGGEQQRRKRRPLRGNPDPEHARPPSSQGGDGGVLGTAGQAALTALVILGAASLLLALFAFGRPTETLATVPLAYQQTGHFGYSAQARGTVYDGGVVAAGQPVYRTLADTVAVTFDYSLTSEAAADVHGTARLDAVLAREDGWSTTIPLAPEASFTGAKAALAGTLDLAKLQSTIDSVQEQIGLPQQASDRYTVRIAPSVTVEGALAGAPLTERFAPELSFQLNTLAMQLDRGAAEGDPLVPSVSGTLSQTRAVPNRLPLPGYKLAVADARSLAGFGLGVTLLGGLVLAGLTWRAQRAPEPQRIASRYGALLIAVRDSDLGTQGRVIDVATIDDLARVAEREGRLILHAARDRAHDYFVQDVDVTYRYRAPASEENDEPARVVEGVS